jgi:2-isopropylmalate synthase
VRLTAKGQSQRVVGEGNGPVNALDHAVRNALLPAYPTVDKFELMDYKVRILDQGHGTDATVRVLIETTDGLSAWTTVGVGQNIIEASWEALCDAYLYGLIHADDEVSAPHSSGSPVRLGA